MSRGTDAATLEAQRLAAGIPSGIRLAQVVKDGTEVAQVFGSPAHAADLGGAYFRLPAPKLGRPLIGDNPILSILLDRRIAKPHELFQSRVNSIYGLSDTSNPLATSATILSEMSDRQRKGTGSLFDVYAHFAGYVDEGGTDPSRSYKSILALSEPQRSQALERMYAAGQGIHLLIAETLSDNNAPRIDDPDPRIRGLRMFEANLYDVNTGKIVKGKMAITPALAYDVGYVSALTLGKDHPPVTFTQIDRDASGQEIRRETHRLTLEYIEGLQRSDPAKFNALVAAIRKEADLVHVYPYRVTDRRGQTMGTISGLMKLAGVEIAVAQAVNPNIRHAETDVVPGDLPAVLQQFRQTAGVAGLDVVNS